MNQQYELPAEVIVDPEAKEVIITPEIEAALPNVSGIFTAADEAVARNPGEYLQAMENSLFSFRSSTGANIECSLIPGEGNELMVVWAPFSDSIPLSSSKQMLEYTQLDEVGLLDKVVAKPNSWNQITKSAIMADVLKAAGVGMSVLTIFSPLPSVPRNAYTSDEYGRIRRGDFTPSARIVEEALEVIQDQLHGPDSETQIDTINVQGGSLGASSAVGTAAGIVEGGTKQVKTVTAQELIIAPENVFPDLAKRFTVGDPVGEESQLQVSPHFPRYGEPLLRRMIDRAGTEPAVIAHMLRGMSKLSRLKGLTGGHSNRTAENIHFLQDSGVSVVIPLADTSGLTHDTPLYLPNVGEQVVYFRAIEGQRTAHIIGEHVGATALMPAMHLAQSRQ
jgi:hypothetical protein